jgi:Protein of unknown function (DUF3644)/EC042_2821-lke REase
VLTAARLKRTQLAFLKFLRDNNGKTVGPDALLKHHELQARSWKVYWSSGRYAPYLTRHADGTFTINVAADVDDIAFYRQVTQKVSGRSPAPAALQSPLARALLEKSKENMILALELYNRPSLKNRLDGFCMLFCAAWDQLLKAEMLRATGDEAIFTGNVANGRKETHALRRCIEKQLPDTTDPVRKNLFAIVDLRDAATHLLMPEILSTYSQLFQSGVRNFAQRYERCCNEKFLPPTSTGLLVLVHEGPPMNALTMNQLYGETTAEELMTMCQAIDASVGTQPDERFAVHLEHKLVLAKRPGDADISLSTGNSGPINGVFITKIKEVSTDETYPHTFKDVVARIEEILGGKQRQNLRLVVDKEVWQAGQNDYHRLQPKPRTPKYSEKSIARAVELIEMPGYLEKAKQFASTKRKRSQSKDA